MDKQTRSALAECLAARRDQNSTLIAYSAVIAVGLFPLLGEVVIPWLAGCLAIQLWERQWIDKHLKAGTLEAAAPTGLAFLFAVAAGYAAIGVTALSTARPWPMVAGESILIGLTYATSSTGKSREAYFATIAPSALGLAIVPILAWRHGGSTAEVFSMAWAAVLVVAGSRAVRGFGLKALEAERLANASKSDFLATVSHEIRTPLNGVLGMAQAMAAGDLAPVQRERLETLRQSSETLLALLNDILDLSKIEAGKFELEDGAFDLTAVCGSTLTTFEVLAAGKGLALDLEIDADARGRYRGDGARVRQVLFNLASNAVKFTERGGVQIRVGRRNGVLEMAVTDTGAGMTPEDLSRLFGRYEQLGASTARRHGGTGLGLSICRKLAHLMGGEIQVESLLDHGSTFRLRLPLERLGEEQAAMTVAERASLSLADASTLRVLAAEDNAVNQLVLRTLLDQAGVDLVVVEDGAKAVEAWRRQKWDLVLMDVQMPVMDGLAAARAIRREEASRNLPATPIIALTANAMAHQIAQCGDAGMSHFVAKPIRVEELFKAMEAALVPSAAVKIQAVNSPPLAERVRR